MYGTYGVCTVTGTTEKSIGGKSMRYYVLKPVYQQDATAYVPADNPQVVARLHRLLSQNELYHLVDSMLEQPMTWSDNEMERKTQFQEILSSGDRAGMLRLIRMLYLRQEERRKNGKRLHLNEERIFREAERMVCGEFAFVLNIDPEEVPAFLQQRLECGQEDGPVLPAV